MTSGKLHKKPDDLGRERLLKRARVTMIHAGARLGKLTEAQKKTPSQLKSERGRAKLNRRGESKAPAPMDYDCRDCPKEPCGHTPLSHEGCTERIVIHRCRQCGQQVRYRWIEGEPWEYCRRCREIGYGKKPAGEKT